ncbi:hypothetical protein OH76DRAFT_1187116 [Lentinus brumalis]|uniref:Uncharacterized protein n=1 Tax=Lentinus brumalis TaxID=2498619 RepID=A0A371CTS8_9APHY|nr:hypothetical protein OH76DRAFT_1187116 [Polyporus brumalis]
MDEEQRRRWLNLGPLGVAQNRARRTWVMEKWRLNMTIPMELQVPLGGLCKRAPSQERPRGTVIRRLCGAVVPGAGLFVALGISTCSRGEANVRRKYVEFTLPFHSVCRYIGPIV